MKVNKLNFIKKVIDMNEPRTVKVSELKDIIALSDRIFRKPGQSSMGTAFSLLFAPDNAGHLFLVEDEGRPVSLLGLLFFQINIAGCRIPVVSMGSVCTDSDYRGNNLAGNLVETALKHIAAEGAQLLLVSGDRSLYLRNDCMKVGEVRRFRIHSPEQLDVNDVRDEGAQIRLWQQGDVSDMLTVLQSEMVFYERTETQFAQLIAGGGYASCIPAEQIILIRKVKGKLDAYIVFGVQELDESNYGEVIEFAGKDEAIVQLVRESMLRFSLAGQELPVTNDRGPLADMLISAGCHFISENTCGTIRMVNFMALWHSLRPYFAVQLGTETAGMLQCEQINNGFRISLRDQSVVVDLRGASSLVFNGPGIVEYTPLKQALSVLFPLPFVYTKNLNYV
jgi:GNAT superfamily N-acetyltransferase